MVYNSEREMSLFLYPLPGLNRVIHAGNRGQGSHPGNYSGTKFHETNVCDIISTREGDRLCLAALLIRLKSLQASPNQ